VLVNLLEETEAILKEYRRKVRQIKYIRNAEGYIPIADFIMAAEHFDYDNGYGEICVDPTLKIVGRFWWLSRRTYDGKEGWEFHLKPKKPTLKAVDFVIKNTRTSWNEEGPSEEELAEGGYTNGEE
jgi:hypothetical protein